MKRNIIIALLVLSIILILSCDKTTEPDNEAPKVEITTPENNEQFALGDTILIEAEANDNKGIKKVEFYIDDVLSSTDDHEPYEYQWIPEQAKYSIHSLYVKAIDTSNNSTISEEITVILTESPYPPSNPSPVNNAVLYSTDITLSWSCSDPEGDSLTYDVYFGENPDPSLISEGQQDTTYVPVNIELETTYYWKIVAKDEYGNLAVGDIWQFSIGLKDINNLVVPDGFKYFTNYKLEININSIDSLGNPIPYAPLRLLDLHDNTLISGMTNGIGLYNNTILYPLYMSSINLYTPFEEKTIQLDVINYTEAQIITEFFFKEEMNYDSDGDNVSDDWDDYPCDPNRAFNQYTPAGCQYGTFMWEDLWPCKGDYDFNDLVMDYKIIEVYDANMEIVEVFNNFYLRAAGAGYLSNGFGIKYPDYWEVDGPIEDDLGFAYTDVDEQTVMFFDNHRQVFGVTGVDWINTYPPYPFIPTVTWCVKIPMKQTAKSKVVDPWDMAPFNPFLTQNGVRSHEIHLPDYPCTYEMNIALFNTADDDTNPLIGKYFKTSNNLPWALHIIKSWDYPIETKQILWAYLYFPDWAESGGVIHTDWYDSTIPGNTDPQMIYDVP